MIPAVPLLALMAADVFPRWMERLRLFADPRAATWAIHAFGAGACLLAFGIHPLVSRQEAAPLSITRALFAHTRSDVPIVTNHRATLKYFSPVYGQRLLVLRTFVDSGAVARMQQQYGRLQIALLDRTDSDLFREDARENEAFMAAVERECEVRPLYSNAFGAEARVRVYDVANCRARKG
ncbi:MAG: hypothetical protein E6H78_20825 [Betaproteobacteria bacterium]|nr:MAG: hypothetical protein E6H78_20825 [Betaproteobacteria bacterium]